MRGGNILAGFTVASVFRLLLNATQCKQRQVMCDDEQCCGVVLYILAYLCDAIWWTLAAARDVNHAHTSNLPGILDGTWVTELPSSLIRMFSSVTETHFFSQKSNHGKGQMSACSSGGIDM